jgi:ATP synthase F1 gamma subunit
MAQQKIILEDIGALNSLKELAESYEEIAVVRMQKIRDSVLNTRDFLAELSDIFVDLKSSYEREVKDLLERRKKNDKTLTQPLQKKDKKLMVYLSSNGKFYGSVTQKTFHLFMQDLKNPEAQDAKIMVIGRAGREMYEGNNAHKEYEYYEIPDSTTSIEDIKKLVNKFLSFEEVEVYYGKFGTVVKQIPIATSITGDDIFEAEVATPSKREDRFIFEPVLEKIFHFFETQIMANLFSQTLLENQLARHSSRITAMEEALVHIEDESRRLNLLKNRVRQQTENIKQMETIAGMALWEE